MSTKRTAVTIFDEDTAMTLVKPYSDEYRGQLFVIYEDAYGEVIGIITPISEIRTRLNISDEEFQEIINQL